MFLCTGAFSNERRYQAVEDKIGACTVNGDVFDVNKRKSDTFIPQTAIRMAVVLNAMLFVKMVFTLAE